MKRALLLVALALAASGCASHSRKAAPAAAVPPPPPPVDAGGAGPQAGQGTTTAPTPAGPVTAPWDTAGTASGKASRRNHVYPEGASALGQQLVDSIPDPAKLARGATTTTAPAPAAPAPAHPGNERACWEVQVLVTTSESKAKDEAKRIEKSLDLAAWVRNDGGIFRVRAGGCLNSDGAAELADRLRREGYPEAFRVMREP